MPEITIQQATFERLQKHAKPLVDSTDSVISRALDALEQLSAQSIPAAARQGVSGTSLVDPRALPALTHTKVLNAVIDGQRIAKPNWNRLLEHILRRTVKNVGIDKAPQICPVNMMKERKTDEGYRYVPDINVSIQGQDANSACRAIVVAAQALGLGVDIEFMWRLKEAAEHPGERRRLLLTGSKNNKSRRSA